MDTNMLARFWRKVDVDPFGCWLWKASRYSNGYALMPYSDEDGRRRTALGHRLAYEHFVGPIPDGLDLDHLCRVRHCVNPAHLEPVTRSENLLRSPIMGQAQSVKTNCPKGHPYSEENTYLYKGRRFCRTCRLEKQKSTRADPEKQAALRAADAALHRAARDKARGAPSQPNAEKTHCKNGHLLAGDNLMPSSDGRRRCRQCSSDASHRAYEKRKGR